MKTAICKDITRRCTFGCARKDTIRNEYIRGKPRSSPNRREKGNGVFFFGRKKKEMELQMV